MNTSKLTNVTNDNKLITLWLSSKPSLLTRKQYICSVNQFLSFVNKNLNDIKYEDVQQYLTMLQDFKKYASSTICNKLNSLKSLFSFAFQLGYIENNVLKLFKNPKINRRISDKLLAQNEIKSLVDNSGNLRNNLLIKTMFTLGLRVSEAIGIKYSDINFDGKIHHLSITGKGNKERILVIPNQLVESLQQLKSSDSPYIFRGQGRTDHLRRNETHKIVKLSAKKSGFDENKINKISCHSLRHSHATMAIANGCDIALLQQSLGHSSITTTNIYLNLRRNEGSSSFVEC